MWIFSSLQDCCDSGQAADTGSLLVDLENKPARGMDWLKTAHCCGLLFFEEVLPLTMWRDRMNNLWIYFIQSVPARELRHTHTHSEQSQLLSCLCLNSSLNQMLQLSRIHHASILLSCNICYCNIVMRFLVFYVFRHCCRVQQNFFTLTGHFIRHS